MVLCLGIDPDTTTTGVALVSVEEGVAYVLRARLVCVDSKRGIESRVALLGPALARELGALARELGALGLDRVRCVAVEGQMKYSTGPKARVSANSLIPLAQVAGMAAGIAVRECGCNVVLRMPKPSAWKGEVPKDVHQRRILSACGMSLDGLCNRFGLPKKLATHVIDAIGLGIWGAKR